MERIGLGLFSYLIGHTPYKELVELSRLAEEKGFEAVVFPELVNDALRVLRQWLWEHTALRSAPVSPISGYDTPS